MISRKPRRNNPSQPKDRAQFFDFNFARSEAPPSSPRAMAAEASDKHPPTPADASLHPLMIAIGDLELRHCRFPIGDPCSEGFGFCGHHRAKLSLPYCDFHMRHAYQKPRKDNDDGREDTQAEQY